MSDETPPLHERLEHLAFLVGSWRGLGVVGYPTITEQRYEQEVVFAHDGRPFLAYESRAWILDDAGERVRPAARESGFWRPGAAAARRRGAAGPPDRHRRGLRRRGGLPQDRAAHRRRRAHRHRQAVTAMHRLYGLVEGRDLAYAVDMAAVGEHLQPHLCARLSPVDR